MFSKTKNFQNCLGVFQGGGCRGAAFVGAYSEAVSRGVSFSEVVGTSAGSIIAALIGAGATPAQLKLIIKGLDFRSFQTAPRKIDAYKSPMLAPLVYLFDRRIYRFISKLGLYDSSSIQQWLDKELRTLLNQSSPVKFKDLIIPVTIVTTDLKSKSVKLFGNNYNEEDFVSEAVRYSCNIPIYFQPVQKRFVDGGLLSNLPTFVFKNKQESSYERILAFSLQSNIGQEKDFDTVKDYLGQLTSTAIDGSIDLQLALQTNIHLIRINTGAIEATDFDKMDEKNVQFLLDSGTAATKQFFDNEVANIKSQQSKVNIFGDYFKSYNEIANSNASKVNEVIISDVNTYWVYELFPTLLGWNRENASVTVLVKENNDDPDHGPYRQRLLKSMGCRLIELKDLPLRGIIINGENVYDNSFALVFNEKGPSELTYHSKLYQGEEDFKVISILRRTCLSACPPAAAHKWTKGGISLEQVQKNKLIDQLKNVKQYSLPDVEFALQEVEVTSLMFLTKYVRGFKFRQIHNLFQVYRINSVEPFLPAELILPDGKSTLVCPPVVEKLGDKLYVIEGNTRLTYAYKNGIKKLFCIVVSGVSAPLPSSGSYGIHEILITDKEKLGGNRYDDFNYTHFRKIESAVRNPKTSLLDSVL